MHLRYQFLALCLAAFSLVANAQVVPYPGTTGSYIFYPHPPANAVARLPTISETAPGVGSTAEYFSIGNGIASSTTPTDQVATCDANLSHVNGGSGGPLYFVNMYLQDSNGGFFFCAGDFTSKFMFLNWTYANNAGDAPDIIIPFCPGFNWTGHGPCFWTMQDVSSTPLSDLGVWPSGFSYSSALSYLTTDGGWDAGIGGAGSSTYPMVVLGPANVAEHFYGSDLQWQAVGHTSPCYYLQAASASHSNAQITLGCTVASSTTTIAAPAGGIILSNVSTGTNADFLCLSSGGVVLLQSSACTISSLRFKNNVNPFTGDALSELDRLAVDSYQLTGSNADPNANRLQIGLIAENIAQVEPRCAIYEDDLKTPKSYRSECITALLVSASQEFHRRTNADVAQIKALQASQQHQLYFIYGLLGLMLLHGLHSVHLHRKVHA